TLKKMLGKTSDAQLAQACCDLGSPRQRRLAATAWGARIWLHPMTYHYARAGRTSAAVRLSSPWACCWLAWPAGINHNTLCRLYKEQRLSERKREGRKRALGTRAPMAIPQGTCAGHSSS